MSSPQTHNGVADSTDDAADDTDRARSSPESERARTGGPDEAWAAIIARIGELREYAGYYVAANVDRLRLIGRSALMWGILGVVIGAIGVSIVIAASVMLVVSLSTGLGQLLDGRIWLGQLIVSAAILLFASGGVWLALWISLRKYQRMLIQKYERRKQEERTEYGTDVEERAKDRSKIA